MKRYLFHSDPGHGWLQVPASELVSLGIEKEISPYSYTRAGFAYLEEDCDLSVFFRAKEAAGEALSWEEIGEVGYSGEAPMRSMVGYEPWYAQACAIPVHQES